MAKSLFPSSRLFEKWQLTSRTSCEARPEPPARLPPRSWSALGPGASRGVRRSWWKRRCCRHGRCGRYDERTLKGDDDSLADVVNKTGIYLAWKASSALGSLIPIKYLELIKLIDNLRIAPSQGSMTPQRPLRFTTKFRVTNLLILLPWTSRAGLNLVCAVKLGSSLQTFYFAALSTHLLN